METPARVPLAAALFRFRAVHPVDNAALRIGSFVHRSPVCNHRSAVFPLHAPNVLESQFESIVMRIALVPFPEPMVDADK